MPGTAGCKLSLRMCSRGICTVPCMDWAPRGEEGWRKARSTQSRPCKHSYCKGTIDFRQFLQVPLEARSDKVGLEPPAESAEPLKMWGLWQFIEWLLPNRRYCFYKRAKSYGALGQVSDVLI